MRFMNIPSDYSDSHRLFFQGMMWRKIGNARDIRKLYLQSLTACEVPHPQPENIMGALVEFVSAINDAIKPMQLAIVKCMDEKSGKTHYALINSNNNHISRMATIYSKSELQFFKMLIESCVCSKNGRITSTQALNIPHDSHMKKVCTQQVIDKFVRDNWLCWSGKGSLYLGPRTLAELDYYITSNHSDVSTCQLCKNIVLQGIRCFSCKAKMHYHCFSSYSETQKGCPMCNESCKESFSESAPPPVGERARFFLLPTLPDDSENLSHLLNDHDFEDDDEEAAAPTTTTTRLSLRRKRAHE